MTSYIYRHHLQLMTSMFLPFKYLIFYFFCLPYCPGQALWEESRNETGIPFSSESYKEHCQHFIINYDVCCRFYIDFIYHGKEVLFYFQFAKVLKKYIMNGYTIFSFFSISIEKITWFFSFIKVTNYTNQFCNVKPVFPSKPGFALLIYTLYT